MAMRVASTAVAAALAVGFFTHLPGFVEAHLWPRWLSLFPDQFSLYVWGTLAASTAAVVFGNFMWLTVYLLRAPVLEAYKVVTGPWPWSSAAEPKQRALFWKLLPQSLGLTLLNGVVLLTASTAANWPLVERLGGFDGTAPFPSGGSIALHFLAFALLEDAAFYWAHRFLHTAGWYEAIHKMHHRYTWTVSLAVLHLHPAEFFLANVLPVGLGPLLLRAHPYVALAWVAVRVLQTQEAHSGYAFPWSPFRLLPLNGSGESHAAHHGLNTGNFGSLFGFWDWVCGTRIAQERIDKRL